MINSMIEEEMPMLRRGFIYLKNNKKRGLLLTGILFVMAMFLFVGGDLRKAAGEELKTVQKQMGGSIQVKADTENQALYVADPDDPNILTFNGSYVDEDIIKKILALEHVEGYFPNEIAEAWVNLDLIPGLYTGFVNDYVEHPEYAGNDETSVEMDRVFAHKPSVIPCTEGDLQEYFRIGVCEIVEGRNIQSNDQGKVVISRELAELNQIGVGDSFRLETKEAWLTANPSAPDQTVGAPANVEIIGTFDVNFKQEITIYTMEYQIIENMIFTDEATKEILRSNMGDSNQQNIYENVTFFADTPENLENILEEIKSLTSSQGLLVEMDESSYQTAAQPLHQIRMISLILMIMAGGICAIILYLLINLWTEGRRKELKILRSLGFTKKGILGQLILEGVILAFVAVLVGTAVSIPIREQIFTVVENWTEPEEGIAEFEEVVTEGNQAELPVVNRTVAESMAFESQFTAGTAGATLCIVVAIVTSSVVVSGERLLRKKIRDL